MWLTKGRIGREYISPPWERGFGWVSWPRESSEDRQLIADAQVIANAQGPTGAAPEADALDDDDPVAIGREASIDVDGAGARALAGHLGRARRPPPHPSGGGLQPTPTPNHNSSTTLCE